MESVDIFLIFADCFGDCIGFNPHAHSFAELMIPRLLMGLNMSQPKILDRVSGDWQLFLNIFWHRSMRSSLLSITGGRGAIHRHVMRWGRYVSPPKEVPFGNLTQLWAHGPMGMAIFNVPCSIHFLMFK